MRRRTVTGIDTNVLVRYLVQDDPGQSALATRFIEEELSADNKGYIASVALCETIWVLARAYKQPKKTLLKVIRGVLEAEVFEVENRDCAWRAYFDFDEGEADYSDYLIGEICKAKGAAAVVTFDSNALKHRLFKAIS
jgi:predicted nucleic-acid-binding protein